MARLYANENFPLETVLALRRLGHDVLTTQDAGRAGQAVPDPDVLAFAIDQDRAVVTFNRRDFIRLHAARPAHAGIIVCTADADFTNLARNVHEALSAVLDLHGQLVRVYRAP